MSQIDSMEQMLKQVRELRNHPDLSTVRQPDNTSRTELIALIQGTLGEGHLSEEDKTLNQMESLERTLITTFQMMLYLVDAVDHAKARRDHGLRIESVFIKRFVTVLSTLESSIYLLKHYLADVQRLAAQQIVQDANDPAMPLSEDNEKYITAFDQVLQKVHRLEGNSWQLTQLIELARNMRATVEKDGGGVIRAGEVATSKLVKLFEEHDVATPEVTVDPSVDAFAESDHRKGLFVVPIGQIIVYTSVFSYLVPHFKKLNSLEKITFFETMSKQPNGSDTLNLQATFHLQADKLGEGGLQIGTWFEDLQTLFAEHGGVAEAPVRSPDSTQLTTSFHFALLQKETLK